MATRVEYGIYPAIGFARVGDHPLTLQDRSTWLLGPERPGHRAWPPQGYDLKARVGGVSRIKKQACRFRVVRRRFEGEACSEDVLDLDHPEVVRVTWRVHVRNAKAVGPRIFSNQPGLRNASRQSLPSGRAALVMDPGIVHVEGRWACTPLGEGKPLPSGFRLASGREPIRSLGHAATDRRGSLLMFAAEGRAVGDGATSEPGNLFNNDDWFDDTCDGSIRAEVELRSGEIIHSTSIAPSWVVTCPPDYAPFVPNLVSLHDVLHDLAVRKLGVAPDVFDRATGRFSDAWKPSFVDDIEPILIATARLRATAAGARMHVSKFAEYDATSHPAGSKTPAQLFAKLRRPAAFTQLPGSGGNMPALEEATLTPTQYWAMYQWSRGRCEPGSRLTTLPGSRLATRAALEQAVGAAFHPGIEVTHSLADESWFLSTPRFEFRIDPAKLAPGEVSQRMALPWHTDFLACGSQWWPTIRPGEVERGGSVKPWSAGIGDNGDMVDKWARLGWIDASLRESERDL